MKLSKIQLKILDLIPEQKMISKIKTEAFYKVRSKNGLFYNPNKSGNRIDPTFDKNGKKYVRLSDAKKAVEFCKSKINTHWCPHIKKDSIETEIIQYKTTIEEIGILLEKI